MRKRSISFIVSGLVLFVIMFMLLFRPGGAASQATQPTTSTGQHNEVAELKKQVAALEQRVGALEEQLAEIHKPKLIPADSQPSMSDERTRKPSKGEP